MVAADRKVIGGITHLRIAKNVEQEGATNETESQALSFAAPIALQGLGTI